MPDLVSVRDNWNTFARNDALWAILTAENKEGGKWTLPEFMETGETEIRAVLDHLSSLGVEPNYSGKALDFGCGVGRLTQALARRFDQCVGVDISSEMVMRAEAFNQYPNCRYITNSEPTLPFPDGSVTFIYTNIVLQHMPLIFAEGYIREFVRLLEPQGLLVFGVPDHYIVNGPTSLFIRLCQMLGVRSRVKRVLGSRGPIMQMNCIPETSVRNAIGSAKVIDIQLVNIAAKSTEATLYAKEAPTSGYVGKQYCIIKPPVPQ